MLAVVDKKYLFIFSILFILVFFLCKFNFCFEKKESPKVVFRIDEKGIPGFSYEGGYPLVGDKNIGFYVNFFENIHSNDKTGVLKFCNKEKGEDCVYFSILFGKKIEKRDSIFVFISTKNAPRYLPHLIVKYKGRETKLEYQEGVSEYKITFLEDDSIKIEPVIKNDYS